MRRIAKVVKVSITMLGILCSLVLSNVTVAQAETIIHTHIWATKNDDNKHWEYCTVCNEKRNEYTHTYTDSWKDGQESCWAYNYCTRVCVCGYSYQYKKDHTNISGYRSSVNRLSHHKACLDCGSWMQQADCYDAEGKINCTNPGTCLGCGATYTSNAHYIQKNGKCKACGVSLIKVGTPTVEYATDKSYAIVKFTMESLHSNLKLTGKVDAHTTDNASKNLTWTSVANSSTKYTYTGKYVFNKSIKQVISFDLQNHSDAFRFNGYPVTSDLNLQSVKLSPDNEKPTVTEIKQKDQTYHNTWATIKELTIKGEENLSNVVSISIKDPATGDIIVDKAEADVENGKYTYKCTPELEGPVEGRKYILIVEDEMNNKIEKDFMIYKTDCRAPLLRSEKEYTEWSQTKNLEFKLTDYGSGSAQTSLINQTSYQDTTLVDGNYIAKYTFAEENYGVTEYKMYVRDGLGNAALAGKIKVGRIDNTKPTVTAVNDEKIYKETETTELESVKLTVEANDINTTLNAEGSGVVGYALTKSVEEPTTDEWQESNVFEVKEAGKYYLWVKDKAGNMADVKVIQVKDDFSIAIDPEEIVVDDDEPTMPEQGEDDKTKDDTDTDKDSNKGKEDGKDNTPKTGDSSYIMLAAGLMLVSGVVIILVKRRKTSRF